MFFESGDKINEQYCQHAADAGAAASDVDYWTCLVFWQNNASACCACETVYLLCHETIHSSSRVQKNLGFKNQPSVFWGFIGFFI